MKNKILISVLCVSLFSFSACKLQTDGNFDTNPPTLYQVTPVSTPTADSTPNYTFNSDQAGTITYGGGCTSVTTSATVGDNTITFSTLAGGTYSNCTITVSDLSSQSEPLAVTSFSVSAATQKIIFVTADTHNGNFGGLSGADAFCMSQATSNVALNGKTFKAILSDSTANAVTRLSVHTLPIKLTTGVTVAIGTAALWNADSVALSAAINLDQNGNSADNIGNLLNEVFTGSTSSGVATTDHCLNWSSSDFLNEGRVGDFPDLTGIFLDDMHGHSCDQVFQLYCLEQ